MVGRFLKNTPFSAQIGILIILANFIIALGAPILAPFGETEIVGVGWDLQSDEFLLGTDHLGRDLLTRLMYGARNTIFFALLVTALAFFIGTTAALVAAIFGGWVNQLISRIVDVLMAFPTLIFALVVLSALGSSIPTLIFVLCVPSGVRVYRVARALALDVSVMDFVEAARLRGEGVFWLMFREILINILPPLAAEFGLRFCFVFLLISSLSFLGLGLQPPAADWGGMVRENSGAISYGIFIPLIPAAAISLLTIGINLVVDWFLQKSAGRISEEI